MQVTVRVNGILAQQIGVARFPMTLPPSATVADLQDALAQKYPTLTAEVGRAIAVVGGVHQGKTAVLQPNQVVAFLMPIAGGARSFGVGKRVSSKQ